MNKQELVKTLMKRMEDFGYFPTFTNVKTFIKEYEKLAKPEPQKPVVPQFVADWIEYCKYHNFTLFGCFDPVKDFERLAGETFEGDARKCIGWCRRASDKIARAWLDGYEVKEEKRYKVTLLNGQPLVKPFHRPNVYFSQNILDMNYKATKKELEDADFGWVFDCPGVEVQEVEE